MKMKRKGKQVHPSPPQPALTTLSSATHGSFSVLNLLPAAILTLVVALSLQDREVLAYMITRSLKTTTTGSANSSSPSNQEEMNLKMKKSRGFHESPVFDCRCFECYTSFWTRWDSSPNREVIHQAIEAFEEHLASGELEMKRSSGSRRGKKKDKVSASSQYSENETVQLAVVAETVEVEHEEEEEAAVVAMTTEGAHKGFARKVLPDVLGVFNWRLWNLWGPNV